MDPGLSSALSTSTMDCEETKANLAIRALGRTWFELIRPHCGSTHAVVFDL